MMNDDIAAETLFGTTKPSPSPSAGATRFYAEPKPETPEETPEEAIAARLYGPTDDEAEPEVRSKEIEALRASQERRMFSAQTTFRDEITDRDAVAGGWDSAFAEQTAVEMREVAADLDLSVEDVRAVKEAAQRALTGFAQPAQLADDAVRALNREFGNGAAQAVRDARKMVARDPRLHQILSDPRLGNNAEIAVRLCHAARRQKAAGRL